MAGTARVSTIRHGDSGWINEPVWNAYKIFKRQTGTEAISNIYKAIKSGAAQGGVPDYFVQGNDIAPCMLGWLRGSLDMASTELSLSWSLSGGPRGIGLPPFGRIAPFYKAAREHAKSRFVNVWLYNEGFVDQAKLTPVVNAIYYEMLATHTAQKLEPDNPKFLGNPDADKAFFKFIAQKAAPEFGARTPIEDVGIYLSTSSINRQMTPAGILNFEAQPHHYALWGWATALDELHYQYRIIPQWKLGSDALGRFKVLIIPNSEVFTSADAAKVGSWVRGGGILIVTGDSGSRKGESGNFAANPTLSLGSLTGVKDWGKAPAVKTRTCGTGSVRFIRDNIGLNYYNADADGRAAQLPRFASEMSNMLATAHKHVAVISLNAPRTTGLTLYQDTMAKKLFLDINNVNVIIAADKKSADIIPTPSIDVTIYKPGWWNQYPDRAVSAYAISPDGPVALPAPVLHGNRIDLRIPPLHYYTSVVLMPKAM